MQRQKAAVMNIGWNENNAVPFVITAVYSKVPCSSETAPPFVMEETAPPFDPTVGLCLGPCGGPSGVKREQR